MRPIATSAHPARCLTEPRRRGTWGPPVHLNITRPGAVKPLRVNLTKFTIDPTGSFMGDIKSLLGSAAVEV